MPTTHSTGPAQPKTEAVRALMARLKDPALLADLLFLERWEADEGSIFEARFGLRPVHARQRLVYDGSQARGPSQHLVEAPDQYEVICSRAALGGQRGVPVDWKVVEPEVDMLVATEKALAATVILDAGGSADIEILLRQVYDMRMAHGRALKIVVRETRDKLRANVEQALLHLGANTVLYRELGFARMVKQIGDMHDTTYTREISQYFASARGTFMPDPVRGYLAPLAFCASVQGMLSRTQVRGLPHSFLRLTVRTHVAHLDAVQACLALRDGDVLTADQSALYVFMFACAESDVDPALARLFTIAPTELFAAQSSYDTLAAMRNCLNVLREAAHEGLPDYTPHLKPRAPRVAPVVRVVDTEAAAAAEDAGRLGPEDTEVAPVLAVRLKVYARPLGRRNRASEQGAPHAD